MKWSTEEDDWFDYHAPYYVERRFSHGERCRENGEKSGDYRGRFFVRRTDKGFEYYCHNCGVGGVRNYSIKTLLERNNGREISKKEISLIFPPKNDWTLESKEWLDKYDVKEWEIDALNIYYTSHYGGRIVMPLLHNKDLKVVGFQARKIYPSEYPKYITKISKGEENVYFRNYQEGDSCICLVEDIVSAIKVGRCPQVSSLSLLGSPNKFPYDLGQELSSLYNSVIIWFDPDKHGLVKKYMSTITAHFPIKVGYILSEKDPKDYDDCTIEKFLTPFLQNEII